MKKINLLFVVILLTILVSCKSKETKEVEVKSVNKSVSGDFEEYVSIVDGTYKLSKSGSDFILAVKLKFLKPCDVLWTDGMEFTEGTSKSFDNFTIDLLDESGTPLGMKMEIDPQLWSSQSESEKLIKALKKGSGEDFYTFYALSFPYGKELESQLEKVKQFQISSSMGALHSGSPNTESSISSSNDNNNEEKSNKSEKKVSKTDCDKYLNGYEKFATSYVAFAKKYKKNPNDQSLATDALKMNTDMAEWATKAGDFDGCDDADFITKLASIQAKLAEAAVILSN
ncbi:MAG: DUF6591 domain-containing protein [Bacteroidota bacterium]